jgi:hypothetical protein
VENNSPAKAGLVGGKLLDLYKRGTENQRKKNQEAKPRGGKTREKRPAYPSFAFVFREQTQTKKKKKRTEERNRGTNKSKRGKNWKETQETDTGTIEQKRREKKEQRAGPVSLQRAPSLIFAQKR